MVSEDLSTEPSPTLTVLGHTTSLEAGFETKPHPTVHGADISDELPTGKGPRLLWVSPMSVQSTTGKSPHSNLITWDGPDDPDNPRNWSYCYKWFITFTCSLLTLNVCVSLLLRRCTFVTHSQSCTARSLPQLHLVQLSS
jgi:hypothetical protein